MLCCSSFYENNNNKKASAKLSTKSNELRFASSNFGVLLFPSLVSVSNDCKPFINNFQNIVLRMTPYLRPVVVKMTL